MTLPNTPSSTPAGGVKPADASLVRRLVRQAWKATLGTIARDGGFPYGSLVTIATAADGAPLLLLSGLAEHTKNMAVDSRASLLIDGTPDGPDALTGPRVTLVGTLSVIEPGDALAAARRRFLSRHPAAHQFIDFKDFAVFRLDVQWAHLVAGFGRIVRLGRDDVILDITDGLEVVGAEEGVLQHMNEDHGDAIAAMAAMAVAERERGSQIRPTESGARPDLVVPRYSQYGWRMIGCDPDGIDLSDGQLAVRIDFPQRVTTTEQLRKSLIDLSRTARDSGRRYLDQEATPE